VSYLLDTCVISELIKPKPDQNVIEWFSQCNEDHLHISCLTLGELNFGIDMVRDNKKRNVLVKWYNDLVETFRDSTLSITDSICIRWGRKRALYRKKGIQIPVIDGLIASTAIEHNYILVTRNIIDFETMNIQLFNPWE
jgi:predicted nucleic acid-binding protein